MARTVVLNEEMKNSLTRGRCAHLWMAAVMLAMTWASETEASRDQARHRADEQLATTFHDLGSDEFKRLLPGRGGSDKSIQVAQATTSDTGALQQPPKQERDWPESLSCELAFARRDIELLQHLEREHDRAEWLVQSLDDARREIEAQKALAAKALEESSRLKQASRPNQAGESGAAELQAFLQEERERSARLEQDLAAARRNVETQGALATKAGEETSRLKQAGEREAAELRNALQHEREQTTRLEQSLAAAQQHVETQAALLATANEEISQRSRAAEASAADLTQSMQKERETSAPLAQVISLSLSAIYAYQAQTAPSARASDGSSLLRAPEGNGTAELQNSLQQERDRAGQLEQALVAARRDVDEQATLAARAGDEVARLTRAAKTEAAEQKRSIQKEQERADALAQDLSVARSKVYAYEAQAAKASEEAAQLKQTAASNAASLEQSQRRERERAEQLARDLAKASRELDAQTERASKAREDVARTKQAGERESAELRSLLLRERERAEGLERDLTLARRDNGALAAKTLSAAAPPATTGKAAREEPPSAPARPIQTRPTQSGLVHDKPIQQKSVGDRPVQDKALSARSKGDAEVQSNNSAQAEKLVARASALLEQGDIGSARIVLERAAEMGSAKASFALAETYDPLILPNFGTYGTQGDSTKARDLYARAEAGGIKEAKARYEALRR
ncbi:hypothetical protein N2603_28225 [Bradyrhizobium huanghuaihaiense]|uniref:hypothetical protein n=1 Tax=Bradyrhizobium huanghuaihaiense TaxID=990078 RepID=UPI0021AA5FAF|nr:hypothetical protein [Bradyrhizobium sp. CB3035]UWU73941.1 hypothetical protein N2603_28225 [Bradyrhizobium sp. CB3035]